MRAIVVTGYLDVVVRREAERLGALHLETPIDSARILGAVAEAIARPQPPPPPDR